MPWIVYFIAGGGTFLPGAGLIVLAIVVRAIFARRVAKATSITAAIAGIILVAISAEAISWLIYLIWGVSILVWLLRGVIKSRRLKLAVDLIVVAATLAVAAVSISFQLRPTLAPGTFSRMYVIGDSISAGIGSEGGNTWPAIVSAEHRVQVIDLARAGSTIADATRHIKFDPLSDGLVVLEVGGNDIIGHASADQFGRDLDALAIEIRGPGRQVVMLELPLFPFDNAYGLQQRRIASKYGFTLIPRRYFAKVLSLPGATIDGIHLSATGQHAMAEMVWGFVGPSLRGIPP